MTATPSFCPIRRTTVRELLPGDHIICPTDGPGAGNHAIVTDLEEDEDALLITINGEFVGEEALFYHKATPNEIVDRLVQPTDSLSQGQAILVRGVELWKWLGETLDPNGNSEQYRISQFRRIREPDTDRPIIELKMVSTRNSQKIMTAHLELDATIGFQQTR